MLVKHFLVCSLLSSLCVSASLRSFVLASVDPATVVTIVLAALTLFDTMASVVMGIVLFRMQQTINSFNRAEDRSDQTIKSLRDDLGEAVKTQIEEKFRSADAAMKGLMATIGRVEQRLAEGDGEFSALIERDHKIEIMLQQKADMIKDYFRDEMRKHEEAGNRRFEKYQAELQNVSEGLAVIADRSGRRQS
jgi:hypothetical protein